MISNKSIVVIYIFGIFYSLVPSVFADTEFGNREFEIKSSNGRCGAKSTPKEYHGLSGTTEVYWIDGETRRPHQTYDWYSPTLYLKCPVSPDHPESISVVRTGRWPGGTQASRHALAFGFYLDEKELARYSTLDISLHPKNVQASVSHHWVLQETKGFQETNDGKLRFVFLTVDGRTVHINPFTGSEEGPKRGPPIQKELMESIQKKNRDRIQSALKKKADLNAPFEDGTIRPFGWTPLRMAMTTGDTELVLWLINLGANVNAKAFDGYFTDPTQRAKLQADPNMGSYSIFFSDLKAWVEPKDAKQPQNKKGTLVVTGNTPLFDAVVLGKPDWVKLFLEKGADPNIPGTEKKTPLHEAAWLSDIESAGHLIKSGANISAWDEFGTPLHTAVMRRSVPMVKFLVEHGADPYVKGEEFFQKTAAYNAAEYGDGKVLKFFLDWGVDIQRKHGGFGGSLLHAAARNYYNPEVVELLIKHGANLEARNDNGHTPLMSSVRLNRGKNAEILLKHGADPNAPNKQGSTPMIESVKNGTTSMIDLMMRHGGEFKSRNKNVQPILHLAIFKKPETLEFLIAKGADLNARNSSGETPLLRAVRLNKIDTVKVLLKHGADLLLTNKNKETPFQIAMAKENWEMVSALVTLDAKRQLKKHYDKILVRRSFLKDLKLLSFLLDNGLDVNHQSVYGVSLLHHAAIGHDQEVVKFLLERGADISLKTKDGNNALHYAVKGKKWKNLYLLVAEGGDIHSKNDHGQSLLNYTLIYKEHPEPLRFLVEKGLDPNLKDRGGNTALHTGVYHYSLDTMKFLLSKGADPSIRDVYGENILQRAARINRPDTVRLMVERGSNLNVQNKRGQAILHYRAVLKNSSLLSYLLEKDIDINAMDNNNDTPLHKAVHNKLPEAVRALLRSGAKTDLNNKNLKTAKELAEATKNKELLQIFNELQKE